MFQGPAPCVNPALQRLRASDGGSMAGPNRARMEPSKWGPSWQNADEKRASLNSLDPNLNRLNREARKDVPFHGRVETAQRARHA